MSRISDEAKLSRRYTNHCLRAEVASTIHSDGVSSMVIMAVTGHRNVQSLASYVKPTDSEKRKISTILSNNNEVSSKEYSSEIKKAPGLSAIASPTAGNTTTQLNRLDIEHTLSFLPAMLVAAQLT